METTANKRLHAIVRGIVQGVNFRYHTRRMARRLLLTGSVCNRPDGTVEVVAEGPLPHLESLVAFLRVGPPSARVDEVQQTWSDATNEFAMFDIR